MTPTIDLVLVTDVILARLRLLEGVSVYDSGVDTPLPISTDADGAPDPLGRVGKYVVLYPGGTLGVGSDEEADAADAHVDRLWTGSLVCSSGWRRDTQALVDDVHDLLYRWVPTIPEHPELRCGRMKPPPGYNPGDMRRNDQVEPPRFWLPLQWRLPITT